MQDQVFKFDYEIWDMEDASGAIQWCVEDSNNQPVQPWTTLSTEISAREVRGTFFWSDPTVGAGKYTVRFRVLDGPDVSLPDPIDIYAVAPEISGVPTFYNLADHRMSPRAFADADGEYLSGFYYEIDGGELPPALVWRFRDPQGVVRVEGDVLGVDSAGELKGRLERELSQAEIRQLAGSWTFELGHKGPSDASSGEALLASKSFDAYYVGILVDQVVVNLDEGLPEGGTRPWPETTRPEQARAIYVQANTNDSNGNNAPDRAETGDLVAGASEPPDVDLVPFEIGLNPGEALAYNSAEENSNYVRVDVSAIDGDGFSSAPIALWTSTTPARNIQYEWRDTSGGADRHPYPFLEASEPAGVRFLEGLAAGTKVKLGLRLVRGRVDTSMGFPDFIESGTIYEGYAVFNLVDINVIGGAGQPVGNLDIALWDGTQHSVIDGEHVREIENTGDPAHNFIDQDSRRFYVQVKDFAANVRADQKDAISVTLGSPLEVDEKGKVVRWYDDNTTLALVETENNSSIFVSKSQILTGPDLDELANSEAPQEFRVSDDDFRVHDGVDGPVDDDVTGDRTHKVRSIDDWVRVSYGPPNAGETSHSVDVPVCARAQGGRLVANLRIHVLEDPYRDEGFEGCVNQDTGSCVNNGRFDFIDSNSNGLHDLHEMSEPYLDISAGEAETVRPHYWSGVVSGVPYRSGSDHDYPFGTATPIDAIRQDVDRARSRWAQACIDVRWNGTVETIPSYSLVPDGYSYLRQQTLNYSSTFNYPQSDEPGDLAGVLYSLQQAQQLYGRPQGDYTRLADIPLPPMTRTTLDVFYSAQLYPDLMLNGAPIANAKAMAFPPDNSTIPHGEHSFIIMLGRSDRLGRVVNLAHELGHIFTNGHDNDAVGPKFFFPYSNGVITDGDVMTQRRLSQATIDVARTERKCYSEERCFPPPATTCLPPDGEVQCRERRGNSILGER